MHNGARVPDQLMTAEEKAAQDIAQERTKCAVKLLDELGLVKQRQVAGEQLHLALLFTRNAERRGADMERTKLVRTLLNLADTILNEVQPNETQEQSGIREGMAAFTKQVAEELERAPVAINEVGA